MNEYHDEYERTMRIRPQWNRERGSHVGEVEALDGDDAC